MTKPHIVLLLATISFFFAACKTSTTGKQEKARKEIAAAEKNFEKMAADKGIAEAFWFFADSSAVIRQADDSLIHGKEGIRNFFNTPRFKNAAVTWTADYVDAAESGDLGYTYGKYEWQSKDSAGKITVSKGIFHTVWKKQKDGSWKYVWD